MKLCSRCHSSLARGRPGIAAKPPPLAICNNWAVIPLPDEILRLNPTWAEFSCCSLGQVAMLYHVVGRNKNSLRSHAHETRASPCSQSQPPSPLRPNDSRRAHPARVLRFRRPLPPPSRYCCERILREGHLTLPLTLIDMALEFLLSSDFKSTSQRARARMYKRLLSYLLRFGK